MSVGIHSLAISDVKLIDPKKHMDHRGFFSETYNQKVFSEKGIDLNFVQDNHSLSVECGVVRGLHFQSPPYAQAKLVRVVRGAIFDVAVDIRNGSPTYGQHVHAFLSADNGRQLFVPSGFAHGFMTLEPYTEVLYKVSNYYVPSCDYGLFWKDPDLKIIWPLSKAILSDKDQKNLSLADLPKIFTY